MKNKSESIEEFIARGGKVSKLSTVKPQHTSTVTRFKMKDLNPGAWAAYARQIGKK